jgi:hypothetical protein
MRPETVKKTIERGTGTLVDEAQAHEEAVRLSFQVPDTMLICAGIKEATIEQYDKGINTLFAFLVFGRNIKSIDGEFLATDIDKRLDYLENELKQMKEKTDSTDTMVKRILDYVERLDPPGGQR